MCAHVSLPESVGTHSTSNYSTSNRNHLHGGHGHGSQPRPLWAAAGAGRGDVSAWRAECAGTDHRRRWRVVAGRARRAMGEGIMTPAHPPVLAIVPPDPARHAP